MDKIISILKKWHLGVSCGQTLHYSQNQYPLPPLLKNSEKQRLRKIIFFLEDSGTEVLGVLENWIRNLSFENLARKDILDRTRLPKIQSFVISGIGMFWMALTPWILPPNLRPGTLEISSSLFLNLLGLWLSLKIIEWGQRKFFFLDFLSWISNIEIHLGSGRSLVQGIQLANKDAELFCNFPKRLKIWILDYSHSLLQALPLSQRVVKKDLLNSKHSKSLSPFENEFDFYLSLLIRAYEEGYPLAKIFKSSLPEHYEVFRYNSKKISDQITFWLFLPLFLLQLPAIALLILAPIFLEAQKALATVSPNFY